MAENDIYQERYLAHQQKKRDQLSPQPGTSSFQTFSPEEAAALYQILESRRSQRVFSSREVEYAVIEQILKAMALCPSSCNRQAINAKLISSRDDKEFLSGILVGGVGWSHRANKLMLLFANQTAYKSPAEQQFMPWLDAGAMIMTTLLAAEANNVGAAYINPNIRETNYELFHARYGGDDLLFCGAIALGYFDTRVEETPKRNPGEVLLQ